VRGALGHPPPAAARAKASPLTGKRDQSIHAAATTSEPGESPGEPPTPEVRLELLFDEARQAFVPQMDGLGPERLEMIAHDLVQHASTGIARRVLDRRQGHAIDSGRSRATRRSRRFPRPSTHADQ
jgi:hypothetical protein